MRVTAVTRYKHGDLFALLEKHGWSQKELAVRAGICLGAVSNVVNLKRRPSTQVADSIQRAFGEVGEYIDPLAFWPESFVGVKSSVSRQTMDIPMESLLSCREALTLPAPDSDCDEGLRDVLDEVLEVLPPYEATLLREFYFEGKTCSELAEPRGCTRNNVAARINNALRGLRRPARALKLVDFSNYEGDIRDLDAKVNGTYVEEEDE